MGWLPGWPHTASPLACASSAVCCHKHILQSSYHWSRQFGCPTTWRCWFFLQQLNFHIYIYIYHYIMIYQYIMCTNTCRCTMIYHRIPVSRGLFAMSYSPLHVLFHISITSPFQVNGRHYQLTSEAWLQNMDRHESRVRELLRQTYPPGELGGSHKAKSIGMSMLRMIAYIIIYIYIYWPARSWLKTWALGGGRCTEGAGKWKSGAGKKKCGKNVVFKIKKLVFGPGVW